MFRYLYIDDKVTIIVLSNRDTTNVGTICDQIVQAVLGNNNPGDGS